MVQEVNKVDFVNHMTIAKVIEKMDEVTLALHVIFNLLRDPNISEDTREDCRRQVDI